MGIKFIGDKELERNLKRLLNKIGPSKYGPILMKSIVAIENNSARRTPIDTGNLRASGLGNAKGVNGVLYSNSSGASAFTSNTAEYAIYVHERTDLRHTVGEAKFLENAVKEEAPKLERKFGIELKTQMFARDMKG